MKILVDEKPKSCKDCLYHKIHTFNDGPCSWAPWREYSSDGLKILKNYTDEERISMFCPLKEVSL